MTDNLLRSNEDIHRVIIDTLYPGIVGWAVTIYYRDGKQASFSVDKGTDDMLAVTFNAIKYQLRGKAGIPIV